GAHRAHLDKHIAAGGRRWPALWYKLRSSRFHRPVPFANRPPDPRAFASRALVHYLTREVRPPPTPPRARAQSVVGGPCPFPWAASTRRFVRVVLAGSLLAQPRRNSSTRDG